MPTIAVETRGRDWIDRNHIKHIDPFKFTDGDSTCSNDGNLKSQMRNKKTVLLCGGLPGTWSSPTPLSMALLPLGVGNTKHEYCGAPEKITQRESPG